MTKSSELDIKSILLLQTMPPWIEEKGAVYTAEWLVTCQTCKKG